MTFHFDGDLAAEYGVNEAVFVHHIFYNYKIIKIFNL